MDQGALVMLSEQQIERGYGMVRILEGRNVPLEAAYWLRTMGEDSELKLNFSINVDHHPTGLSRRQAYAIIQRELQSVDTQHDWQLQDVKVILPNDKTLVGIRDALKDLDLTSPVTMRRFYNTVLGHVYVADLFIYRLRIAG